MALFRLIFSTFESKIWLYLISFLLSPIAVFMIDEKWRTPLDGFYLFILVGVPRVTIGYNKEKPRRFEKAGGAGAQDADWTWIPVTSN
jgi:uncharacterized membrane protein YqaE (UPF0057 family)